MPHIYLADGGGVDKNYGMKQAENEVVVKASRPE